jgi:hypothetical protein
MFLRCNTEQLFTNQDICQRQGWQKPGFFEKSPARGFFKKAQPGGFFGFYWFF